MDTDTIKRELKYTLREIAGWVDVDHSEVKIPDLQRGLVWKPRQMELLWDSLLRGFPIGAFILSDAADGTFFLMDGQQRFNAIATGFGASNNENAMLWLDIQLSDVKNSTRAFWVKSTTKAHPWGFKNNDDCTTLSSSERRAALDRYGMKGKNIYKDPIELGKTWPIEAVRPIPLQFFLEAPMDSPESFAEYIEKQCAKRECLPFSSLEPYDMELLKDKFYPVIQELYNYSVQCDILPRTVIERESKEKEGSEDATPLEVLFTRLNTGGTRITQEDLNYSAIKAYWGTIKQQNNAIAERYMSPSKLVMLAFRLALTKIDGTKGLRSPLSIRQIRKCSSEADVRKQIEFLYNTSRLSDIMTRIDSWLNVFDRIDNSNPDSMPAVIRTSIARNSPDVFLLLMYLADTDLDGKIRVAPEEVRGLALLLHWFSIDKKKAAGTVFSFIRNGCDSSALRQGISECIGMNYLLPIYAPADIYTFFPIGKDPSWNPWSGNDYAPWHDFYCRLTWWGNAEAREMLLFAQRVFINSRFTMYDPAREEMWEEHNRPWDYDHIIPQNWIKERGRPRAEYRDYCDHWLYRIGNVAAIPFEDNRSKGDREAYAFYEQNAKELLFYEDFKELSKLGVQLPESLDASYHFAQISFKRTIEIYRCCYNLLSPLIEETTLTDGQNRRRQVMSDIASKLEGAEIVFVAKGNSLWREYPVTRDADWSREWLSVGIRRNDKFFIAFTWGCNDGDHLEVGVRKLPGTDITKNLTGLPEMDSSYRVSIGDWWYAWKNGHLQTETSSEDILVEMRKLLERFDNQ